LQTTRRTIYTAPIVMFRETILTAVNAFCYPYNIISADVIDAYVSA